MKRHGSLFLLFVVIATILSSGCASSNKKSEMRDRAVASSGLACDFVNGEKNRQVELELNIVMAKKCDLDKPYTVTDYKTPAEVTGLIYCCRVKDGSVTPVSTSTEKSKTGSN